MDGLVINLSGNVSIDGFNSAFEGTSFYGKGFKIEVDPITHKKYDQIKRQYINRRTKELNEAAFEKELFMTQVKGWSNFFDQNGKEIPYSEKVKEAIADGILLFCRAVNIACLNARLESNEAEEKN